MTDTLVISTPAEPLNSTPAEALSDLTEAEVEQVVTAAETIAEVAEGQIAIAGQQAALAQLDAAIIIREAEGEVAEAVAIAENTQRSTEELWQMVTNLQEGFSSLAQQVELLKTPPTQTPLVEVETAIVVDPETISPLTPNDTLGSTEQTLTEALEESAPVVIVAETPAAPAKRKRYRNIL